MYTKVSTNNSNYSITNLNTKTKLILFTICTLILILFTTLSTSFHVNTKKNPTMHTTNKASAIARNHNGSPSGSAIASACASTLYPTACQTALTSLPKSPSQNPDLFSLSVQFAMKLVHSARTAAYNLTTLSSGLSSSVKTSGLDDCLELLDATIEHLTDALAASSGHHDVKTWLSAALTYQSTCAESLQSVKKSSGRDALIKQVDSLCEYISNSLALYKHLKDSKDGITGRKLMSNTGDEELGEDGFPRWLSVGDRRLLGAKPEEIKADAVVAKDGSGTHTTIGEALEFVRSSLDSSGSGGGRSVIYVKAGTYHEYLNIPTKQKNVMLMGDGKGKSVIVGSKSAGSGSTTYGSATVGAMGAGFIAKDLTIINDSGPAKHQAVALRVGADKSVVYQCSLEGYQDTLYTLSNRQFYSQNDISGTVDFIFGNSAVVIQNCLIQPRKPGHAQKNSITAQGRSDPNQNTGISIHKCTIRGSSDLGGTPTYLGRPWKKYARVVFMASSLDGSISSSGWEPWSGSFATSTVYYGEYGNTGPGSSTSGRVRWGGVHPEMSSSEAEKFTVGNFIVGDYWLPGTGVSYTAGL